jgi:cytochrome c oxidase subunit 1
VNRRLWDGGQIYTHAQDVIQLNVPMSYAALALGVFQTFFIANVFGSLRLGRRVSENPWSATTLEWASGTEPVRAYRDPYEYSVEGAALDYVPQNERAGA